MLLFNQTVNQEMGYKLCSVKLPYLPFECISGFSLSLGILYVCIVIMSNRIVKLSDLIMSIFKQINVTKL